MSEFVGEGSNDLRRLLNTLAPDTVEIGAKIYAGRSGDPERKGARLRKPRFPPPLVKETVMTDETQMDQETLDKALAKFVDDAPTPEKRAEALIKINIYNRELDAYLPALQKADDELTQSVLDEWFAQGDGELKKALCNARAGEGPQLIKSAPPEAPSAGLAALTKMIETAPEMRRPALAKSIQFYAADLDRTLAAAGDLQLSDEQRADLVKRWVEDGDGTHRDLKKAVADAEAEKHPVKEVIGNASSAAGSLTNSTDQKDKTHIPARSSSPGAGNYQPIHSAGQGTADSVQTGSGPTTDGGKGVDPKKVKRKVTTGGVGSIRGTEKADQPNGLTKGADTEDQQEEEGETLAEALVKFVPEQMIEAVADLSDEDKVAVFEDAAQHAADLMAWSAEQGDTLAKSALDGAVQDWLTSDPSPDAIKMKKWTAEALATAEEIPLDLARAIMGWEPTMTKAAPQLRQPYAA
jgi:hypothetical protein